MDRPNSSDVEIIRQARRDVPPGSAAPGLWQGRLVRAHQDVNLLLRHVDWLTEAILQHWARYEVARGTMCGYCGAVDPWTLAPAAAEFPHHQGCVVGELARAMLARRSA